MFGPRLEALATSCVVAAEELDAAAIIVLTTSGDTAQAVAKYRPACPILAIVVSEATANRLVLSRGVIPLLVTGRHLADGSSWMVSSTGLLRAALKGHSSDWAKSMLSQSESAIL